jgi:hypothetical protein
MNLSIFHLSFGFRWWQLVSMIYSHRWLQDVCVRVRGGGNISSVLQQLTIHANEAESGTKWDKLGSGLCLLKKRYAVKKRLHANLHNTLTKPWMKRHIKLLILWHLICHIVTQKAEQPHNYRTICSSCFLKNVIQQLHSVNTFEGLSTLIIKHNTVFTVTMTSSSFSFIYVTGNTCIHWMVLKKVTKVTNTDNSGHMPSGLSLSLSLTHKNKNKLHFLYEFN